MRYISSGVEEGGRLEQKVSKGYDFWCFGRVVREVRAAQMGFLYFSDSLLRGWLGRVACAVPYTCIFTIIEFNK